MKTLTYNILQPYDFPEIIRELFKLKKVCIFDIETTGLNRNKDEVILIGYMFMENGKPVIKQLFAESHKEEKIVLLNFYNDLKNFDLLITYNGKNFDIPFLESRFLKHNIDSLITDIDHIDVFQHLKLYKNFLNISNYKLKSIESFLGIDREDTISGKESVLLYEKYVKTKSKKLLDKILLHNYEDIYHLGKVLSIYNHIPVHKKEFSTMYITKDYYANKIIFRYNIIDFVVKDQRLFLYGRTEKFDLLDEVYHHPSFSFEWLPKRGVFELSYLLKKNKIDNKRFFYSLEVTNMDFLKRDKSHYEDHIIENNLIVSIELRVNIDPVNQLISDTMNYILNPPLRT